MKTLADYLTGHDSKPRPDGPECIRLAAAAGVSSYYLYLAALGHKKFSPEKAIALHRSSIGGELMPEGVPIRSDVEWQRDQEGRVTGYAKPVAKVA